MGHAGHVRVLIAGCGYVGLALGRELVQRGHEVFGLRRSRSAAPQLIGAGIQPLYGDLSDPRGLAGLPSRYDWVVNCASSSGGGEKVYRAIYLEGASHLLEWLTDSPPQKYVYTSSTSVYGQTDGSLMDEAGETEPAAATAKVLVAAEKALVSRVRASGFPAVILRVAAIYGPERGYWFKQFMSGEARLEEGGARWLNMVHRDDVAGALVAALQHGRPGECYNAVDDEPVKQVDLFRWLAAATGRPSPPSVTETGESGRKRGATNKRVSNWKLKAELGYRFKYPTFREGYREFSRG